VGAFTANEINETIVFVSKVKGGRLVVGSAEIENIQQESHDGHATYQSSLSHAFRHPVSYTPDSALIW